MLSWQEESWTQDTITCGTAPRFSSAHTLSTNVILAFLSAFVEVTKIANAYKGRTRLCLDQSALPKDYLVIVCHSVR